ncbi:hypothetical protein [Arthrobacter sp. ov118]|nr:hypothetical protein [Arthrobacter sp. ov118]
MSQFLHGGRPAEEYWVALALGVIYFALCGLFTWTWRTTSRGGSGSFT